MYKKPLDLQGNEEVRRGVPKVRTEICGHKRNEQLEERQERQIKLKKDISISIKPVNPLKVEFLPNSI
jgi:hypothetical protein